MATPSTSSGKCTVVSYPASLHSSLVLSLFAKVRGCLDLQRVISYKLSPTELDIPGYCYDETTKRYYKLPPRHFAELPSFSKVIPSSKPEAVYTPTSKPSHDMSLYNLVQRRQLALSDVYYPR